MIKITNNKMLKNDSLSDFSKNAIYNKIRQNKVLDKTFYISLPDESISFLCRFNSECASKSNLLIKYIIPRKSNTGNSSE